MGLSINSFNYPELNQFPHKTVLIKYITKINNTLHYEDLFSQGNFISARLYLQKLQICSNENQFPQQFKRKIDTALEIIQLQLRHRNVGCLPLHVDTKTQGKLLLSKTKLIQKVRFYFGRK